jgi:phenylalanyl-tRNA synthetase beta chain
VTANRPDCMSVVGIAREVATAYGVELKVAALAAASPGLPDRGAERAEGSPARVGIFIDNPELCPRYVGALADVQIGPSPAWMQARLTAGGVRPISNIVDITNYVLLELGQPMHAFDHALIGGQQIRVRTAKPGETLKTLDGEERALTPDMLVIADAEEPIALAGVKGGAKSEITGTTRVIVFESAHFNALSVRRTSKKLGLKTDASMRFERGTDPALPARAMARACALLEQIGAGQPRGGAIDCHPAPVAPRTLALRRAKLEGLLGTPVPDADVARILTSLGFEVASTGEGWRVTAPTRRVDVVREVDVIEEIARHRGFDQIPVTFPTLTSAPPLSDPRIARARELRHVMTGAGFSEALTFGFVGEAAAAPFAGSEALAPITNPLSENFAVLRPSALPGLLDSLAHNRRREQRDVRLFEIGNRFSQNRGERRALACVWTGAAGGEHWSGGAREVDFFDAKGIAERVLLSFGLRGDAVPATAPWLVAGRAATLVVGDTPAAVLGLVTPAVAEQHGLPGADAVYAVEIDLDACDRLAPRAALRVDPLPRFPSVTRDIAILVSETLAAADLRRTIRDAAPATLVRVREFDRYQGKGVPEGNVSLALRLTFRAPDRTLTDTEVQSAMESVLSAVKTKHDAVQR